MSKVLLSTDLVALAKTEIETSDGKIVVKNSQNVDPILERNKRWQNDNQGVGETFRHVAHIPLVTMLDLQKRGIWNDEKKMAQWLNDPDNKYFRVWKGRI